LLLNNLPLDWVITEKIDGKCYSEIDHDQLKQWGVSSFGERCSILRFKKNKESSKVPITVESKTIVDPDTIKSRRQGQALKSAIEETWMNSINFTIKF